jgi:hypothetical protein
MLIAIIMVIVGVTIPQQLLGLLYIKEYKTRNLFKIGIVMVRNYGIVRDK